MSSNHYVWRFIIPYLTGDDIVKLVRCGDPSLIHKLRHGTPKFSCHLRTSIFQPPLSFSKYMAALIMATGSKLISLSFKNTRHVDLEASVAISWNLIAPQISELKLKTGDSPLLTTILGRREFTNLERLLVQHFRNYAGTLYLPSTLTWLKIQSINTLSDVIPHLPVSLRELELYSGASKMTDLQPLSQLILLENLLLYFSSEHGVTTWSFLPPSLKKFQWYVNYYMMRHHVPNPAAHGETVAQILPNLEYLSMPVDLFNFTNIDGDDYRDTNCGLPTSLKHLSWGNHEMESDRMERLLSVVGHQLTFLDAPIASKSLLPYISRLKNLNWAFDCELPPIQILPSSLTELMIEGLKHSDLALLPPTLTKMTLLEFTNDTKSRSIGIANLGLIFLDIRMVDAAPHYFCSLPTSLTELIMSLEGTLNHQNLSSLRRLKRLEMLTEANLDLNPFNMPPFLTSLELSPLDASCALLRPGVFATQFPLLRTLSLRARDDICIPLHVCLNLPPHLTHLTLFGAEAAEFGPALAKALPRSLRVASNLVPGFIITPEAMPFLPPYLVRFSYCPDLPSKDLIPIGLRHHS